MKRRLSPLLRRSQALLLIALSAAGLSSPAAQASEFDAASGLVAAKPLFRDPVYDGAADPVLVWDRARSVWRMFYTNRRANVPSLGGVAWVHGTPIGIAESSDQGAHWRYVGTAKIDDGTNLKEPTYWAPEIVDDGATYHMFLTLVPGVFEDWRHPRTILHLKSKDLDSWSDPKPLKLASERVIDACVMKLDDGTWRMWYNNEVDRKSIYFADSKDLETWVDGGKVVSDQSGEGPKVFRWKGCYWMVTDVWRGLAIYKSADAVKWERQKDNLLQTPGLGEDDQVKGGHPDVVVSGDRAFLFYFTHPGLRENNPDKSPTEQRRSSIQVVELEYKDGWLSCDRNRPTQIRLAR